jgi:hypothetical protein
MITRLHFAAKLASRRAHGDDPLPEIYTCDHYDFAIITNRSRFIVRAVKAGEKYLQVFSHYAPTLYAAFVKIPR